MSEYLYKCTLSKKGKCHFTHVGCCHFYQDDDLYISRVRAHGCIRDPSEIRESFEYNPKEKEDVTLLKTMITERIDVLNKDYKKLRVVYDQPGMDMSDNDITVMKDLKSRIIELETILYYYERQTDTGGRVSENSVSDCFTNVNVLEITVE